MSANHYFITLHSTKPKLTLMKKVLFTYLAMAICVSSLASTNVVQWQNDDETRGEPKPNIQTPTITFDESSVYLRTDSGAVAANITITGTGGTIMYSGETVLTPGVQAISVPDTDGEEKYMIEITTDRRRLYGYFM